MLVLRRRAGEAIVIGADIEIEIIEISRTRVKLGVRAPRAISVSRREAVVLATENQIASAFFPSRGREGVEDLARLLRNLPGQKAQTAPPPADM